MSSYKATRLVKKSPKVEDSDQSRASAAVFVNKNVVIDESIDDAYGASNIKGVQGKWKNVSLLSGTQLNAESDMLKGLVCIQVCDESEFKALRQAPGDKKPATSTKPSQPTPSPKSTTSLQDTAAVSKSNDNATKLAKGEPKKLSKAQQKELELLKKVSGGAYNPKFASFDNQSESSDSDSEIKSVSKPTIAKKKSTAELVQQTLAQKQKKIQATTTSKPVHSPKGPRPTPPSQPKSQPISKTAPVEKAVKAVLSAPAAVTNKPSFTKKTENDDDIVALQWFDDLSDDEYTKKTKKAEKIKKLELELQKQLDAEKLKLSRSLNDEFEAMNDVDEDDEFEFETIGMDGEDEDEYEDEDEDGELDFEEDQSSFDSSNPLSSLVQLSGSDGSGQDDMGLDSDDDDNDSVSSHAANKVLGGSKKLPKIAKTTKTVSIYETKIAPHMFPPKAYLETTIHSIEEDEQDDLSSAQYYSSPNATLFHYHQDYQSWLPFNLHPFIQLAIIREKFTSPRQIQAESLLPALRDRKDIVGIAQTGSGKTLAFLFPVLQHIIEERDHRGELDSVWMTRQQALKENEVHGLHFQDNLSAIVITPTRELAMQIADQVKLFGSIAMIKPTLIVGGIFLEKQLRLVAQNSPLIIGTPGRIWDVMKSFGSPVDLTFLRFLILDEADRMVATGHFEELNNIIDHVKMATLRRKQDSERVQKLLLEQQFALREAMVKEESELELLSQNATTLSTKTIIKRKTPPTPTPAGNNDSDDDQAFNPSKKTKSNKEELRAKPVGKKIDFGSVFADADCFDLDKYLANIEKQRRGNDMSSKNKDVKGKQLKPTTQNNKKQAAQKSTQKSDEEEEDDEDEDDELNFLHATVSSDDEDDQNDELKRYVDSDVDLDDLMDDEDNEDSQDEDEEDNENNTPKQYGPHFNHDNVDPTFDPSDPNSVVQLDDSKEGRKRLDQALIEKHVNFNNRIPQKLQVFLFSATLALQDSAREYESKKIKLSARELSQKQGLIKSKGPSKQGEMTAEEMAEKQRQEALIKQREESKTRLVELSKRLTLDSPQIVDLTSALILPPTLQQYSIELAEATSRDQALYGLLYNQEHLTAIVFVNSVHMTRKIVDFLRNLNVNAIALHGDSDQKGRIQVIEKFRKNCVQVQKEKAAQLEQDSNAGFQDRELQARGLITSNKPAKQAVKGMNMKKYGSVLVCTDIVARGLDIPHLDLVVHYHVPFDAETYIHRCGRTARGTNFGKSVVIVSPEEDQAWRIIQHTLQVGLGKNQDSLAAASKELNSIVQNQPQRDRRLPVSGAVGAEVSIAPSNVTDVRKIAFNSKYLVHIRERLRYAHQLAESQVEEKAIKKEKFADAKIRDALGFEEDDWELSKKEKNRRKNETEGMLAYENNKDKSSLKKAKFELNFLLKQRIYTQGGSFQW